MTFIVFVCVFMMNAHVIMQWHMWGPEDNFQELFLFFHKRGFRDRIHLGSKSPTH